MHEGSGDGEVTEQGGFLEFERFRGVEELREAGEAENRRKEPAEEGEDGKGVDEELGEEKFAVADWESHWQRDEGLVMDGEWRGWESR